MEVYPEELRTPPVALVALVGMPELHPQISMFLHTEQPPINTLALPDFSKVLVIGGKERRPVEARMPPPVGILKADWLHKHRTKVPAVLAVLFDREQVNGDPAQWLQVCTHLDNIKNVIRGRNTKLVVAIVQPSLHGETNDDRVTAVRKRAEIDAKSCLTFISHEPTELKRSLARLGSVLGELSNLYYREEARRVKARLDKKNYSAPELAVRYNFKMAYYAEFRRDWATALRFYETAYTLLQEVVSTPVELQPVQRIVEVKAVAEQLHFKVSTLLLHSGKETEAVKWFRQHIARYKKLVGPPEAVFLHWAWISQQYYVFAELLKTSFSAAAPSASSGVMLAGSGVSEQELQPGFYYQVAAAYMTERRKSFEMAFTTFEAFDDAEAPDVLVGPPEEIGPPPYVGHAPRILSRGSIPELQSPTPAEYIRHVTLTERQFLHSRAAISLLTKAHEQYKLIQSARMIYYLGTEMGREYFHAGEHENAKRLFDSVAGMYRKEAWVVLLGASLGYLRDSARQVGLLKEYVEYSLELAALPVFTEFEEGPKSADKFFGPAGPLCMKQRLDVHNEAVGIMQGVQNLKPVRDGEPGISATETTPVALEIDPVSPLRGVLSVCVAFHDQVVKPGKPTCLTISLLTHLPLALVLNELEIQFNQPTCNLILKHSPVQDDIAATNSYNLHLEPYQWKRLVVDIVAGKSGKLECLSAVGRIAVNATIRCQVESPASREPDPLWVFEPKLETLSVKDINLAFVGQRVIQVEEPDALVDIELEVSGPALLGETFPVRIQIRSTGHAINSGELQVSTSAAASSDVLQAFSPTTPAAGPSPAKLLLPAKLGNGNSKGEILLWELQGPIKVPPVGVNDSWSTTILLRWTEVKRISLVVSLGYQTYDVTVEEAQQLWVHKNAELECQDALGIDCRYIAPFRRDSFLPASLQEPAGTVLPLNETSTLAVSAKNICTVPVCVFPIQAEEKNARICQIKQLGSVSSQPAGNRLKSSQSSEPLKLMPGEVFNQLLWVRPMSASKALDIGVMAIKWEREQKIDIPEVPQVAEIMTDSGAEPVSILQSFTTTRVALPAITVEKAPLIVSLQCPPYGLLGVPFTLCLSVQNKTAAVQEVKFAVVDTQGFLVSGASRDSISLPPSATDAVSLKLVPVACGMQQLPQVMLTSVQYNASYQPPTSTAHLFIFPSKPHLQPETSAEAFYKAREGNDGEDGELSVMF